LTINEMSNDNMNFFFSHIINNFINVEES
jgi:hypothetical protein